MLYACVLYIALNFCNLVRLTFDRVDASNSRPTISVESVFVFWSVLTCSGCCH